MSALVRSHLLTAHFLATSPAIESRTLARFCCMGRAAPACPACIDRALLDPGVVHRRFADRVRRGHPHRLNHVAGLLHAIDVLRSNRAGVARCVEPKRKRAVRRAEGKAAA